MSSMISRLPRVLATVVAAAGVLSGAWASDAQAQLSIVSTGSPGVVRYPHPSVLTFTLRLTAGAVPERFDLEAKSPHYRRSGGVPEGTTITTLFRAALSRPGQIEGRVHAQGDSFANCFHGYDSAYEGLTIALPAGSVSTLVLRFRAGEGPPWVGLPFAPTITARPLAGSMEGTLRSARRVVVPYPRVLGRFGARLLLFTSPATSSLAYEAPTLARGTRLIVNGRISPAVAHQEIELRVGKGTGPLRTLARVWTRRGGWFRYAGWRPASGDYRLSALMHPRNSSLLPSYTCPQYFTVR